MIKWILGLAVITAFELTHDDAFGFTVLGSIESKYYDSSERLTHSIVYKFKSIVGNCVWDIKLIPTSPTNVTYEVKYDGNNIYFIHDSSTLVEKQRTTGQEIKNVAIALVVKGSVPHDPFAEGIGPVWLAYASSCYFNRKTNDEIEPMFSVADGLILQDQIVHLKGAWQLDSSNSFPTEVRLFNQGNLLTFRNLESQGKFKYPPPYDVGFVICQFNVTGVTNLGYLQLPASAHFKVFGTKQKARSNKDLRVVSEHEISCHEISVETLLDDGPPELPGPTLVKDSRFLGERVAGFSYLTDKRMLTDSEVRNVPQYQTAKRVGLLVPTSFAVIPHSNSFNPWMSKMILGIMALPPFVLVAFLLLKNRGRSENKNTK